MRRITYMLPVITALAGGGFLRADDDQKNRHRAERRLSSLETRAGKITTAPNSTELSEFLQHETLRLIERCRALLPSSSYRFDRTLEATEDLLDSREELQAADRREAPSAKEEKARSDTAKRLERAYFRVQQAEYFARLSGDKHASEYITFSRQLYQRARAAYDEREYHRANRLGSASRELVSVLENLAQAAVRERVPPELK